MINNITSSQKYKITFILIAINIAFYVYTSLAGGNFLVTDFSMVLTWGQINSFIFAGQNYYQLFTSMFIHASIVHLFGNMLFLLIFGLRGEEMFSLPEFLTIYFLGGLAGNLLSLLMGPLLNSVGASGAIFAVFGAAIIYSRKSIGQSITGALIFAFFLLMISSGPNVNNLAHMGGLFAGLLIGYVLASRRKPQEIYESNYSYGGFF